MIDDAVEQVQALTRLQAPDPWDRPGSTMTNGTAENTVASVNGQVVMVKYKGGEQKIIIGSDATIRKYVPGTKDELKAGAGAAL